MQSESVHTRAANISAAGTFLCRTACLPSGLRVPSPGIEMALCSADAIRTKSLTVTSTADKAPQEFNTREWLAARWAMGVGQFLAKFCDSIGRVFP